MKESKYKGRKEAAAMVSYQIAKSSVNAGKVTIDTFITYSTYKTSRKKLYECRKKTTFSNSECYALSYKNNKLKFLIYSVVINIYYFYQIRHFLLYLPSYLFREYKAD